MAEVDFNSMTPAEQQELLDGPSLAPPTGAVSNFNNALNGNGVSYATIGLCLSLSTVFLFLRAYATFTYLKRQYLSDYVMAVAYRRQLFMVGTNFFVVTVALVKAAIILEWLRIFVPKGTRNTFFWISHALLWVNGLINVAGLFTINLTCIPHEKIWNRLIVPEHCINGHAIDVVSAAVNLFIDLLILLLPQSIIWTLMSSTGKRIGVAAVFAVGLLACVAAAFRLVATIHYSFSLDTTYNFSAVGLWAVAETTCGILVFSVPTAPKAFAGLGRLKSSWTGRSPRSGKTFPPGSGDGASWPLAGNGRAKPRMYEELDDSQLIMMDTLG
ncbi:hypothetical protein Hte_009266 [Hypoxylon texense]